MQGCTHRSVAAGLVSPVSTGLLFPSLVACLVSLISAIVQQTLSTMMEFQIAQVI